MSDGATEKDSKSLLLDLGLSTKVDILANPYIVKLKCDGDEVFGPLSLVTPCFQEKLLNLSYWNLYLEPTQVVKKRILR